MSSYPESVYRVLEYAEQYTPLDRIPEELDYAVAAARQIGWVECNWHDDARYRLTGEGQLQLTLYRAKQPAAETAPKPDDSDWPRQAEVARRFGWDGPAGKVKVQRLLAIGELKDNGKEGKARRVDPASILAFCVRTGATYNET